MNGDLLHFLNLQYIFYLIYTLFFGWRGGLGASGTASSTGSGISIGTGGSSAGGGISAASAAANASFLAAIGAILAGVWTGISFITYGLSFLFIAGTLYAIAGILLIRQREEEQYRTIAPAQIEPMEEDRRTRLLAMVNSDDPKAWRDAIFGADDLLREMLISLGYVSQTVDEQLSAASANPFSTLPAAWEAHRAKNIVESGADDFILTKAEAVRVMHLYLSVFEEHRFA